MQTPTGPWASALQCEIGSGQSAELVAASHKGAQHHSAPSGHLLVTSQLSPARQELSLPSQGSSSSPAPSATHAPRPRSLSSASSLGTHAKPDGQSWVSRSQISPQIRNRAHVCPLAQVWVASHSAVHTPPTHRVPASHASGAPGCCSHGSPSCAGDSDSGRHSFQIVHCSPSPQSCASNTHGGRISKSSVEPNSSVHVIE